MSDIIFDERTYLIVDKAVTMAFNSFDDDDVVQNSEESPKLLYAKNREGSPQWPWINLRLDWELLETSVIPPVSKVAPLLALQASQDITDLIENGDQEVGDDPLLRYLDGTKKTGKTLESLDIVS